MVIASCVLHFVARVEPSKKSPEWWDYLAVGTTGLYYITFMTAYCLSHMGRYASTYLTVHPGVCAFGPGLGSTLMRHLQ